MSRYIYVCLVSLFWLITNSYSLPPTNFSQAKKIAGQIFSENPQTLYCGCRYAADKTIDLDSCSMQAAQEIPRAHRMEWEHMMPAENFGRQLSCWREKICSGNDEKTYKGRKCCAKASNEFRQMEGELYNLWPAVGLVNQARSNYRFSDFGFKSSISNFYGCSILIDHETKQVEPRDLTKGIVARANLFMSITYGIKLSHSQQALFEVWNKQYPPSEWEKKWAKQVAYIEGYINPYIK
ncbi:MAG TPA: endonuclease [Gammaproteobacteria bacterium]|nr:endonuclease [Gammaproteobacteria bacterium]HVY53696.1 endonuclease [Gammaproteobacteria bacterium]